MGLQRHRVDSSGAEAYLYRAGMTEPMLRLPTRRSRNCLGHGSVRVARAALVADKFTAAGRHTVAAESDVRWHEASVDGRFSSEVGDGNFFSGAVSRASGAGGLFEQALREVLLASRVEGGCLEIHGYRSLRDRQLFYIHSRWAAAFEAHAKLPHTAKFLGSFEGLLDSPPKFTQSERIG